jgi:hypothetical protein
MYTQDSGTNKKAATDGGTLSISIKTTKQFFVLHLLSANYIGFVCGLLWITSAS